MLMAVHPCPELVFSKAHKYCAGQILCIVAMVNDIAGVLSLYFK